LRFTATCFTDPHHYGIVAFRPSANRSEESLTIPHLIEDLPTSYYERFGRESWQSSDQPWIENLPTSYYERFGRESWQSSDQPWIENQTWNLSNPDTDD
jgi:hypothetical protein